MGYFGDDPTHSYLGKNAIGASWRAFTQHRYLEKKITVSAEGIILAIGCHIRRPSGAVVALAAALYTDDGTDAASLLAFSGDPGENRLNYNTSSGQWLNFPIGVHVSAGDYWIAVGGSDSTQSELEIAYDTSGSDRYHAESGQWHSSLVVTTTATTDDYSLRASFLTL